METFPRISVVTSSYNQGGFIERTIQSVLAQEYPNLEHIVVDGMSSDETPAILARYPHLRVIREPDRGQADAINKGFRLATGEIFCFLNSDDTLLPGALHRVAQEFAANPARRVVMGRCRFIDEHDRFLGIEHPSAFESHWRVLAIWKGHSIPQPAVFWLREVWERCGPLNEQEQLLLDYDLFCRFSRHYHFHCVDQVLATYRLHADSKTSAVTDEQRLEQSVTVSRRYWPPPGDPQFWRLLGSYALYRLDRRRHAIAMIRSGRAAWRQGRRVAALPPLAAGALLGADVVADVFLIPRLKPYLKRYLRRPLDRMPWLRRRLSWLRRMVRARAPHPQTRAWRDYTALHSDGWAGPVYATEVEVAPGQSHLRLAGNTGGFRMPRPLELQVYLGESLIGVGKVGHDQIFDLRLPLGPAPAGRHTIRVVANRHVVPHDYSGSGDYRPLAYQLTALELVNGS